MLQADRIWITQDSPEMSVSINNEEEERQVEIFLVHLDPSKPPTQFKVACPKDGNIEELCLNLTNLADISAEGLIVTYVYCSRIYKIYSKNAMILELLDRDDIDIFVYETDPTVPELATVPVYFSGKYHRFEPMLVSLPRYNTGASLYEALLIRMSRYITRPEPEDEWWRPQLEREVNDNMVSDEEEEELEEQEVGPVKLFSISFVDIDAYRKGQTKARIDCTADDLNVDLPLGFNSKICLRLDWHPRAESKFLDEKKAREFDQDDSCYDKAKPIYQEYPSQEIHIRDVKKEVFSEVLRFVYTGKVSSDDSLKNLARDILVAANKYQLDLLKKLCEAQLYSTLNDSNCFDLLVLGDLYQAVNLKMAALEFVSMNSASLIETDV